MSGQTTGDYTPSVRRHTGLKVVVIILSAIFACVVLLDVNLYLGWGWLGLKPLVTADSKAAEEAARYTVDGVSVKTSVEQYSWDELSILANAISTSGSKSNAMEIAKTYGLCTADEKLDGTQTKSLTLSDGTQTSAVIVGFYHDDKSDGTGKAGITFMFKDGVASMAMNTSGLDAGGWQGSEVRNWLASTLLTELPSDLASKTVAVNKYTNNVGATQDVASVTTTSDMLWLFSVAELCGSYSTTDIASLTSQGFAYVADIIPNEGMEYELFADTGVYEAAGATNVTLQKLYAGASTDVFAQGAACVWWERTPNPGSDSQFLFVDSGGNPTNNDSAATVRAIAPGFCL